MSKRGGVGQPTPFRVPSFQHRAYIAEAVVQHILMVDGKLLGWSSHEEVVAFHKAFATWPNPPELWKGAGRSGSAYYGPYPHPVLRDGKVVTEQAGHYIRLLARERHVLAYTHELAHSIIGLSRGDGHTPAWAGCYVALLDRIDPHAAKMLRTAFTQQRLTIKPWSDR